MVESEKSRPIHILDLLHGAFRGRTDNYVMCIKQDHKQKIRVFSKLFKVDLEPNLLAWNHILLQARSRRTVRFRCRGQHKL